MKKVFRELMVTGLGALFLTKDKLTELVDDLVEQGKMSREEAAEFVDQMIADAQKQRETMKEKVKEELKGSLQNEERVNQLEERVRNLELQVKALEKKLQNNGENKKGIEVDDT
ncbi:hypothetical protein Halha_1851 [Halobacteroides halobius DSM 5150]|uniref:Polyhydroxyalkanoate synthesis regulator phasin n=1 Tax=Halobacteroides halobius (strain ATCC 35273 / DSM 5150 / MD-1) TaxID=748449 RepID=L0KBL6_HALHC|nr:hypothetical protein [Halobacteroides halobius]AGB41764.1 hypothetical protein Halha_1851 [Halobacteroides halobius DSM 5150]